MVPTTASECQYTGHDREICFCNYCIGLMKEECPECGDIYEYCCCITNPTLPLVVEIKDVSNKD